MKRGKPSPIRDVGGLPTYGWNVPTSNGGGRPFGGGGNKPPWGGSVGLPRSGNSGPPEDRNPRSYNTRPA